MLYGERKMLLSKIPIESSNEILRLSYLVILRYMHTFKSHTRPFVFQKSRLIIFQIIKLEMILVVRSTNIPQNIEWKNSSRRILSTLDVHKCWQRLKHTSNYIENWNYQNRLHTTNYILLYPSNPHKNYNGPSYALCWTWCWNDTARHSVHSEAKRHF